MTSGVSTACLYPLETEKSLDVLLGAGFRTFEIFFNTHSEITPAFARALRIRLDVYGARVVSCHFYTSGFEPFMLFTAYRRRFEDGLELYRRYCEVFAMTGAKYAVFHGDRRDSELPLRDYCERFGRLNETARREGVTLAHENVSRCRSATAENVAAMRGYISDMRFVLDIKQALRAGQSAGAMIDAMGGGIVNVHVSDSAPGHDCLPPGTGGTGCTDLVKRLAAAGYSGPLTIELYRSDFAGVAELTRSARYLDGLTYDIRRNSS